MITDNARFQPATSTLSGRRFLRAYSLALMLVVVTALFTAIQPAFIQPENVIGILYQVSLIGTMAVSSTFVIITGGIDLSVGPVVALAGLAAVFSLRDNGQVLVPALFAGLLTGLICGVLNGIAVAAFRLPAIVVTLATVSIYRGAALLIGGSVLHQVRGPESFLYIGSGRVAGFIPFPIFIFVGMTLVMYFLQTRTRFGLTVFATGENAEAARLCGLPVARTRLLVYLISGIGAAIGGIVLSSQVSTGAATYGNGIELDVIAAIVLGGTSLRGGSGSVLHTVIGALLIGEINNGLSMLNVSIEQQLIAKGLIIVLAIALSDRLSRWADK
jgi:ribose/xylose/arabinose/galactoside ABC-type transport system permease subunit